MISNSGADTSSKDATTLSMSYPGVRSMCFLRCAERILGSLVGTMLNSNLEQVAPLNPHGRNYGKGPHSLVLRRDM